MRAEVKRQVDIKLTSNMTEEEFDQALESAGVSRENLQLFAAQLLGMPVSVASLDSTPVIVGGLWPGEIRGSVRDACGRCARYVALSPSSQRAIVERPSICILCVACACAEAEEAQSA